MPDRDIPTVVLSAKLVNYDIFNQCQCSMDDHRGQPGTPFTLHLVEGNHSDLSVGPVVHGTGTMYADIQFTTIRPLYGN